MNNFWTQKGHGRRRNPRGKDGTAMTCRTCGSEEHFAAKCPRITASGASAPPPTFHSSQGGEWHGLIEHGQADMHDGDGPLRAMLNEIGDSQQSHFAFMATEDGGNATWRNLIELDFCTINNRYIEDS